MSFPLRYRGWESRSKAGLRLNFQRRSLACSKASRSAAANTRQRAWYRSREPGHYPGVITPSKTHQSYSPRRREREAAAARRRFSLSPPYRTNCACERETPPSRARRFHGDFIGGIARRQASATVAVLGHSSSSCAASRRSLARAGASASEAGSPASRLTSNKAEGLSLEKGTPLPGNGQYSGHGAARAGIDANRGPGVIFSRAQQPDDAR